MTVGYTPASTSLAPQDTREWGGGEGRSGWACGRVMEWVCVRGGAVWLNVNSDCGCGHFSCTVTYYLGIIVCPLPTSSSSPPPAPPHLPLPSHRIKSLDLVCMKQLDKKVNIIPVIAKADTVSRTELNEFKRRVSSAH